MQVCKVVVWGMHVWREACGWRMLAKGSLKIEGARMG